MDLLDRARRTIRRHGLATAETRVVAALSGGSDSVALVQLLTELHRAGDLRLVGLAHFNHQLRNNADGDERYCLDLAARLQLPIVVEREDVRAFARRSRRSLEDAARTARHAFFGRALVQLAADAMALGHTRDDQAETFLLRLLRGAGARGLASMYPKTGPVIRPLLDCRRADLIGYVTRLGLTYVTDESNADVSIPRNRVRAELLPLLERRFNPSIVDVLADEAAILRDEHEYLTSHVDLWLSRFGRKGHLRHHLSATALTDAPAAVARAALHQAMREMADGRAIGFADVERALAVARNGEAAFDAPGQRVERFGGEVVLKGRPAGARGRTHLSLVGMNLSRDSLSIPGEIRLRYSSLRLTAEVALSGAEDAIGAEDPSVAVVQLGGPVDHLEVRSRRPGDRFRPLGLRGRKKLQDFLVDRKVPRRDRDAVPIVVDSTDRIVWVAGYAIDKAFRVKDPAQTVIILRLKGFGGSD